MGSIASNPLADLTAQIKKRDTSRVPTFQAFVQDVSNEKLTDARYVGDLRPNQNRLNVFSLASRGDPDDSYRFNLKSGGNVHLAMLVDSLDAQRHVVQSETAQGLGIQVLQYQGSSAKVIADSDPNSGAANQMYNQLTGGEGARLAAGKYVVRVYRQQDTSANAEFYYSLQLVGDRYSQDYDTMQREAPAHPPTKSALETMAIDPAVTMLAQSMDPTLGVAMIAATRPATLTTTPDDGTAPATKLLDAFM
jgi:hypothetical protein